MCVNFQKKDSAKTAPSSSKRSKSEIIRSDVEVVSMLRRVVESAVPQKTGVGIELWRGGEGRLKGEVQRIDDSGHIFTKMPTALSALA